MYVKVHMVNDSSSYVLLQSTSPLCETMPKKTIDKTNVGPITNIAKNRKRRVCQINTQCTNYLWVSI